MDESAIFSNWNLNRNVSCDKNHLRKSSVLQYAARRMKWDAMSSFCLAACAALEFGLRSADDTAVCERFSDIVLSRALRNGSPVMFLVLSSSILRRT